MPASFRCFSSGLLVLAGTGALLVLLVILITGGFVLQAGPLRLSAHSPGMALAVAALAWGGVAMRGMATVAAGGEAIGTRLDRHAPAAALVLACAAAGVGVGAGTYSASGADASGYVSQAALLASGRLARDEPLAHAVRWPDAAGAFAPLGYRPGQAPGETVPTYPPGLPLVSAAAVRLAGGEAVFIVVPLFGALAVACTYRLGVRLHSRRAGVVAAALLATSPILLFQLVQPMSDVPVTAWWALALAAGVADRRGAALASGAAAGLAVLTRPNLVPLLAVTGLVAAGWPRRVTGRAFEWKRFVAFAGGSAPGIGAVLLLHERWYGSPITSGYGTASDLFAAAYVWPNVLAYGWRLVRGEAPAFVLALVSLGGLLAARRCPARDLGDRAPERRGGRLRGPVALAALVGAAVLACYLPYFTFSEWSYLRFLLPALPTAFVLVGALAADAARALPKSAAGIMILGAVTAAGAFNVNVARLEGAFDLRRFDVRYVRTGRYLAEAAPPNAVLIALQESGSLRHYAGRPVVRWDLLEDLDGAAADLAALGLDPMLVVEDWEAADLRARFPNAALARLDWTPRADIGAGTRVRVFAASDRERRAHRVPTDRFE